MVPDLHARGFRLYDAQLEFWMDMWMHTKLCWHPTSPLIGQRCPTGLAVSLLHDALVQRCTESRKESETLIMAVTSREKTLLNKAVVDLVSLLLDTPRVWSFIGPSVLDVINSLQRIDHAKSSFDATRRLMSQTAEMLRHARSVLKPSRCTKRFPIHPQDIEGQGDV